MYSFLWPFIASRLSTMKKSEVFCPGVFNEQEGSYDVANGYAFHGRRI